MNDKPSRKLVILYSPVAVFGVAAVVGGAVLGDPQIGIAGVLAIAMYLSIFPQIWQAIPVKLTAGQLLALLTLLWFTEITAKALTGRGLSAPENVAFGVMIAALIMVAIRREKARTT